MSDQKDAERPEVDDIPDGSNSDGTKSAEGADTASGGGADDQ